MMTRTDDLAQSLYEDAALRGDLPDRLAARLLSYGVELTPRTAAADPQGSGLRRLLRRAAALVTTGRHEDSDAAIGVLAQDIRELSGAPADDYPALGGLNDADALDTLMAWVNRAFAGVTPGVFAQAADFTAPEPVDPVRQAHNAQTVTSAASAFGAILNAPSAQAAPPVDSVHTNAAGGQVDTVDRVHNTPANRADDPPTRGTPDARPVGSDPDAGGDDAPDIAAGDEAIGASFHEREADDPRGVPDPLGTDKTTKGIEDDSGSTTATDRGQEAGGESDTTSADRGEDVVGAFGTTTTAEPILTPDRLPPPDRDRPTNTLDGGNAPFAAAIAAVAAGSNGTFNGASAEASTSQFTNVIDDVIGAVQDGRLLHMVETPEPDPL